MSRPALELTIYPKTDGRHRRDSMVNGRCLDCAEMEDIRLTEPELAACYWMSLWEYDARLTPDSGSHWYEPADGSSTLVVECNVLERFASLPHASENGYE